jgi:hypothetical protein
LFYGKSAQVHQEKQRQELGLKQKNPSFFVFLGVLGG